MNRRHHALLAPLFAVLALLLGLTGSAAAAFNAAATDPHYGNFLLHTEAPARMPLEIADPDREIGVWLYDSTLGVPVYVQQNPWSAFDQEGLDMFGINTNLEKRTDTFTVFGGSFTVGGLGTNYNAGWLNGKSRPSPNNTNTAPMTLREFAMDEAKQIPRDIKNMVKNPVAGAKQLAADLLEYPGNPTSMGNAVLAKSVQSAPQLITEGKIAMDSLKSMLAGGSKSARGVKFETMVELDQILIKVTSETGKSLGGLAAKYDFEAKSLAVGFVGVTEKGKGIGTELYRRMLAAAGEVKKVTGTAVLDNAAAIKKGGIEAAPRTKILDKLGDWTHTFDEATKTMEATRK